MNKHHATTKKNEEVSLAENTERVFLAWQKYRKRVKRLRWIIPPILVWGAYVLVILFLVTIGAGGTPGNAVGLLLAVLVYVGYIVAWPFYEIRRLRKTSIVACIYTASAAAGYLKEGNPLKASLFMGTLLLALSDFLRQKSVTVGKDTVALKDVMSVVPEAIPRKAVFRAVQANEDTKDFQDMLGDLVSGLLRELAGDADIGSVATHQFLASLYRKIEIYRQSSQTFSDRHPTMITVARVMERIVPLLGLLVIEVVRQLFLSSI